MKKEKTTAKEVEKPFWKDEASEEWKAIYHQAVEDYLESEILEPKDLGASILTCKLLIPKIADKISEWKTFPKQFFNVNEYTGHRNLFDCVRNKLSSLVKEQERVDKEEAEL